MKPGQYFALITGIFFLAAGLMGFLPAMVHGEVPVAEVGEVYSNNFGYLMGIFPVNAFHNAVHIIVGLLGILSSIALASSRVYGRGLAIFYGVLAIMGLLPYANTTFGLIPIYGNDVWLHGVTAAIAFYFGFIASPGLLELSSNPVQKAEEYSSTPSNS